MLVPSESNSSNGTDVESENDTQTEIRLHPGKEKKRREALWTGSRNPERPVS